MRALPPLIALLALPLVGACGSPVHLSYDYGRAYTAAFGAQADLTRPSVATGGHSLEGIEGVNIRLRVIQEATDKETENTNFKL